MALWSLGKAAIYFLLIYAALFIWTFDYDKRPCNEETMINDETICMLTTATDASGTCTTPSVGGSTCATDCPAVDGGCISLTSSGTSCLNEAAFTAVCEDTNTCADQDEADMKQAIAMQAFVYTVQLVQEIIVVVSMCRFAEHHYRDFRRLSRMDKCIAGLGKNGGFLASV
jgi:hypothetical protein